MSEETLAHWLEHFPEQGGVWIGVQFVLVAYDGHVTVYKRNSTDNYVYCGPADGMMRYLQLYPDQEGTSYSGFW